MHATVQLKLDQVTLSRLCRLGYLRPSDRNPAVIRDAAAAALADRLAPSIPVPEPPMGETDFAARKAKGTRAETALCDLLVRAGGIVELHQQNRDAGATHGGAAVAVTASGRLHLPDMSILWPAHPLRRFGVEVKAKSPPNGGGWGWDVHAFNRACQWSITAGTPVLYVVRDISTVPLPPPGELDNADNWHFATVWKLLGSGNRVTTGQYHFWPDDDFLPLCVLLEGAGDIAVQSVPFILPNFGPPILL